MIFFEISLIYYKFKWSGPDFKDRSFRFYFIDHSYVPVMPELGIRKHFLDQMVTEGDSYHEYGVKAYSLTEGDGSHKEEWFDWSFKR